MSYNQKTIIVMLVILARDSGVCKTSERNVYNCSSSNGLSVKQWAFHVRREMYFLKLLNVSPVWYSFSYLSPQLRHHILNSGKDAGNSPMYG